VHEHTETKYKDVKFIQGVEKAMPKFREVTTKKRFTVKELHVRDAFFAALQIVKLGVTEVGNQAKPLKYSGGERKKERRRRSCI